MTARERQTAPAVVNPLSRRTPLTADPDAVGDQGVAVVVAAGQVGAPAAERAGQARTGKPKRASERRATQVEGLRSERFAC